jgi:uncharacterized hydrophobic protein (TIGR00271 family)
MILTVAITKTKTPTLHRENVVNLLVKQSTTDFTYYFLLALSTFITTFGLTLDSEAIVVGGMLMAPLLKPVLALGLAIATLSPKSLGRAILGIVNSLAVVLILSFSASLLFHGSSYLTTQISSRGMYSNLYIIIAILSGIGAAYSLINPNIKTALPGMAVSVSLLPPLCVSGISLAQENTDLLINSQSIFWANLVGIVLSSAVIFLVFRFAHLRRHEETEITKQEINESTKA